jgi:hypothetical protein
MIKAIIDFTSMRVRIVARSLEEFEQDLETIKEIDPQDRCYDDNRREWIVKRYENYSHLPFVANAIKERRSQLELTL